MNLCDAKHQEHDHIKVMTDIGPMMIYDWKKYMGYKGYCTGQDDVSLTLGTVGYWDLPIKNLIMKLLSEVKGEKCFIDVGSHVGYFSKLAENMGAKVFSYEAEGESLDLLSKNAPTAVRTNIWFDEKTRPHYFEEIHHVDVMKIDIEGSERFTIEYFRQLINEGRVQNIIMEVSPTFNGSYPTLIAQLRHSGSGYEVLELDGTPFDYNYNFPQKDLWFKKI